MKRLASILMIFLLILSLASCGSSDDSSGGSKEDSGFLPVESLPDDYIYWYEAFQHIGEVTTVVGPVNEIAWGSSSSINIGAPWNGGNTDPESVFIAHFWYSDKDYVEENLDPYVGKTVMVYGKIENYQGTDFAMIDISLPESRLTCLNDEEAEMIDDGSWMFDPEEFEDEEFEEGYDESGFLPVEPLPDDYIYWYEAYQHIGEVTTVVGPVVSLAMGSASYINIGNDYSSSDMSPDSIFMARFWYNDKDYNEETLGPYEGRTVMVYGEIQDWNNGIPMIDISLPESRLTCLAEDY